MLSEAFTPCTHLGLIKPQPRIVVAENDRFKPFFERSIVCQDCLGENYTKGWVHLRQCMICGHIGCCNSSDNKHATRHAHEAGHPIVRSIEPREHWGWCYFDQQELEMNPYPHTTVVLV